MTGSSKKEVDYRSVMREANSILISSRNIDTFPFEIKKVISEQTDCKCKSYSKAKEIGIDISAFGSEDAILMNYYGMNVIFYDNTKLKSRVRFSLAHELGHYILGHNPLDKDNYSIYEIEANYFAAQLLMPEQLINALKRRGKLINSQNLENWFSVSKKAAGRRLQTLRKLDSRRLTYEEKDDESLLLSKYKDFINQIARPNNYIYDIDEELEKQSIRDSWH